MKTKSITALLVTGLAIAFATSVSASPPGKGRVDGASTSKPASAKVERPVKHDSMKRIGAPGKGYPCTH